MHKFNNLLIPNKFKDTRYSPFNLFGLKINHRFKLDTVLGTHFVPTVTTYHTFKVHILIPELHKNLISQLRNSKSEFCSYLRVFLYIDESRFISIELSSHRESDTTIIFLHFNI